MKRDMNAIRHILLEIEKNPAGHTITRLEPYEGLSAQEYLGHIDLLIDAGYVKGRVNSYVPPDLSVERITWQGLDFLQSAKDDRVWEKAQKFVIKESASWSMALLKEYLRIEGAKLLGIENFAG